MRSSADAVRIELLGDLRVHLGERTVDQRAWPARRAWELVALLALADGRRLARDQVLEALWPHLDARAGAANLRKAAHHARRALADDDAVVLRGGVVALLPEREVEIDVARFLAAADAALSDGRSECCAAAAEAYTGELLPDAPYEAWAQEPRRRTHERLVELLRRAESWDRLAEVEPTDEEACQRLMSVALARGRRHEAIRWFERLRLAMVRELGLRPGPATQALYDRCTADLPVADAPYVGRAAELAAAMSALQSVADGGAIALLIRGSAGMGKSAFCREVLARAAERGWQVVDVAADAAGPPYGPIRAVAEQLVADRDGALDALPQRTRAVLAALADLDDPAAPLPTAVTRHRVVAALRRIVAPHRTVIHVDDAHLCDEASGDLLHQLVAGAGGGAFVVLLSYRAEWIRASLPHGIAELGQDARAHTVALGPLTDAEIAELVTHAASVPPSADDVSRLTAVAEGSPFFALELVRALGSAPPGAGLPQTVREAIADRLLGLDEDVRQAVTALAVAEGALDLATVRALTGLDEEAANALLDAALASGVLVVTDGGYRFRHVLVRQALADDLPPHRRLQLHRGAAERLAASGGPPERIADHLLKGERPGEAVRWLLVAARRAAAVGAFVDALAHVEALLLAAPEHLDGLVVRAEILDALGDGRAPGAYAAAALAAGEPAAQELSARQALAELKASDPDRALRTLRGVRPRSTAGRLAEALTLSAAAAIGRYADAETAAAKAEEAHQLALELGDPGAILDATWAHALAAHATGRLPARLREYLHAASELPELATRLFDGQLCVTERMLYGGLPNAEIIAFATELADEAQRLGAARGHAFALTLRGEAAILAGRLDAAEQDFAEGARLHGRIGAVAGEALSLLGRAQVATYRDRRAHARPLLADALLMARESEVGHHTLDRIFGAMVDAAADPAAGVELVHEAEISIQGPAETCPTCRIAFIVPATIAAARGGELARAHRYAGDCSTALEIVALPPAWHAAVEEARGWVAQAERDPEAARRYFAAAADGFRTWGQPLDAQRCGELARA